MSHSMIDLGNIPSELGHLRLLEGLWLYNNQLTGASLPLTMNLKYLNSLMLLPLALCSPVSVLFHVVSIGVASMLKPLDTYQT